MTEILTRAMLDQVISDSIALDRVAPGKETEKFRQTYMESLEVVNDDGTRLGSAPRGLVHRVGLRHTVVYCVIFDEVRKRMLLQTRGSGRLDISVGGHVKEDEVSYLEALSREFTEELGLVPDQGRFTTLATYNRDAAIRTDRPLVRNRERRYVYSYVLSQAEMVSLSDAFKFREEQEEVLDFKWVTSDEAVLAVKNGRCADGLAASLEYILL